MSENHETCRDVMIYYVKAMIKKTEKVLHKLTRRMLKHRM